MNHYQHFTIIERELILHFLSLQKSMHYIAKQLSRSTSSISREIRRNKDITGFYSPSLAQEKYTQRRHLCGRKKILSNLHIRTKVQTLFLEHQWSPEQISNRLRLEKSSIKISFNTIYRGIYSGMLEEGKLSHGQRGVIRKLRHRGKSRHTKEYEERRGKIRITNPIANRPKEAEERNRKGDWEADTVAGKTGKACLVTLTDRRTRFLLCQKIEKKNSLFVKEAMIEMLESEPLETITPDRGKEFSKHPEMTKALKGVPFYFPLPHHPWQRGTNENTNGLLREYFPKTEDMTEVEDEYIISKVLELNKRPRKCLGWRSPYEMYYDVVLQLT